MPERSRDSPKGAGTFLRLAWRGLLAAITLSIAYLLIAPARIDPVAWLLPKAREWPSNQALAHAEWLHKELTGPESIAVDGAGRIVTGLSDGRIVRIAADGSGGVDVIATTGGRPLGLKYAGHGRLIIADAVRGLIALESDGRLVTLSTGQGGVPFRCTDDLDIARDGTIYFSDVSSRFGLTEFKLDLLEHRPSGRLLAYHPDTHRTELVAGDLTFANGVAMGPDDEYVLVNETASYRVSRVWLRGPRAGQRDVFIDNLPGFPDNITYSSSRRAFWIAIASPRDGMLDAMGAHPWLRTVASRLPESLMPKEKRHAWALAVDENGAIVADLQDPANNSYSPITSVIERDGWLYLGSFNQNGLARVRAPK